MKSKEGKFKSAFFPLKIILALIFIYSLIHFASSFIIQKNLYKNASERQVYLTSILCPIHFLLDNKEHTILNEQDLSNALKECTFTQKELKKRLIKDRPTLKQLATIDEEIISHLSNHLDEMLIRNDQFKEIKTSKEKDSEDEFYEKLLEISQSNEEYKALLDHLLEKQ
ncbi:MAG: hypothetical protein AAF988_08415 [Pseudomonadota bacterium]